MRKMFAEAADEIEQLRNAVKVAEQSANKWKREAQGQAELRDLFIRERDEARRMACEKEETLGCDERGVPRNGSARDHAKRMGWDCFKENSDD